MILNLIRPIQSRSATVTVYPLMQCKSDGIRVSIALATVNSINNNLVNNASLRATFYPVYIEITNFIAVLLRIRPQRITTY